MLRRESKYEKHETNKVSNWSNNCSSANLSVSIFLHSLFLNRRV
jgi:hypothetical protein